MKSRETNRLGKCRMSSGRLFRWSASHVTFTVDGVTHTTVTYHSAANHDPDGVSDGTSINITRP